MADSAQKITPQMRASLFAQQTRQNLQQLPEQVVTTAPSTMQVNLPKARYLAGLQLDFQVKLNIKHASNTTVTASTLGAYNIIRRVTLDFNNGFSPFVIDGKGLALYNMVINSRPDILIPQASNARGYSYFPAMVVSAGGTDNTYNFTVELPVTLNDRDPVGLFLLQNDTTNVTLTVDIANGSEVFGNQAGYTVAVSEVRMKTLTETYSVPPTDSAQPDISVIKLVQSRTEQILGSGQAIIKLPVGQIYRKIIIYMEDNSGVAFTDSALTSNLDLVFNQADQPYSVNALALAKRNTAQYGTALPAGVYVLPFDYQGVVNLGCYRDLIDTEKLTELWLRFSTNTAGKIYVVTETMSRLA